MVSEATASTRRCRAAWRLVDRPHVKVGTRASRRFGESHRRVGVSPGGNRGAASSVDSSSPMIPARSPRTAPPRRVGCAIRSGCTSETRRGAPTTSIGVRRCGWKATRREEVGGGEASTAPAVEVRHGRREVLRRRAGSEGPSCSMAVVMVWTRRGPRRDRRRRAPPSCACSCCSAVAAPFGGFPAVLQRASSTDLGLSDDGLRGVCDGGHEERLRPIEGMPQMRQAGMGVTDTSGIIPCVEEDVDRRIVTDVSRDGRATLSRLSAATGLSVSAVQARSKRLEARGPHRVPRDRRSRGGRTSARGVRRDHSPRPGTTSTTPPSCWNASGDESCCHSIRGDELHAPRPGGVAARAGRLRPRHPSRRLGAHRTTVVLQSSMTHRPSSGHRARPEIHRQADSQAARRSVEGVPPDHPHSAHSSLARVRGLLAGAPAGGRVR